MDNNKQIICFLIDYIEEHISEEISLDELAEAAGYSKYHLHRMFTGMVGLTLHWYIKRRQLTDDSILKLLSVSKRHYSENSLIDQLYA